MQGDNVILKYTIPQNSANRKLWLILNVDANIEWYGQFVKRYNNTESCALKMNDLISTNCCKLSM